MPGVKQCVVCSASLAGEASAEDVTPPRARDRSLRQRPYENTGAGRFVLWLRRDLSRSRLWLALQTHWIRPVCTPSWWHVLLCIIPGVGPLLAYGALRLGLAHFLLAACALLVASGSQGTLTANIATSLAVALSVFSVFVFVDKHWGSQEQGTRAWQRRVLLLAIILAAFGIANYFLGYVYGIVFWLIWLLSHGL